MLVKAQLRGDVGGLARHLTSPRNEVVKVLGTVNTCRTDITGALHEMRLQSGTDARCVLHVKLNPDPSVADMMTDDQWRTLANHHRSCAGLDAHSEILVLHRKNGRTHAHVVAGARNLVTGRKYRDWGIYKRNVAIQRRLCELMPELGMMPAQRGKGAVEPGGVPGEIAKRLVAGPDFEQDIHAAPEWTAATVAEFLGSIWTSDDPISFVGAAAARGVVIAAGDRSVVAIAPDGNVHSLPRRLALSNKEVCAALKGVSLPGHRNVRGTAWARKRNVEKAAADQQRGAKLILEPRRRRIRREQTVTSIEAGLPTVIEAPIDRKAPSIAESGWLRLDPPEEEGNLILGEDFSPWLASAAVRIGRNGIARAHLITGETLRMRTGRISIHHRPALTAGISEDAIVAAVTAGREWGWHEMCFSGPQEFRERAAVEAARQEIEVGDLDLRALWEEECDRLDDQRGTSSPNPG